MKTNIIWPEDLHRVPYYGGEEWIGDGKLMAQAEYPTEHTADSAKTAGLFTVICDYIGIYDE